MSVERSQPLPSSAQPDGLPVPRRYWAIVAILLAICMSVLDSTIANIALPSIASSFRITHAASVWVINAYQVAILVALLPLASLGEVVGYRRISQTGLVVFTLASLGCAFAPSLAVLSVARVVQGLGAAGIMSVNAALVRFTYPQRMLGRAIGINAFVIALSAAIGPTVAAAVLAVAQWRWLFAINVPIGIVAITFSLSALPDSERVPRDLSYVSTALNAGAFMLLVGGLQTFAHEQTAILAMAQIAAGCVLAYALVRRELRSSAPLLPLDLLRVRLFRLSVATSVCSFIAQMAALVALPFEIEQLGRSPVETGLLMTPWSVAVALTAPLAGRLADRHHHPGILGGVGLLTLAAGLLLLATMPHPGTAWDFIWRMAVCGAGFGLFQSPNNRAMLSSAPRARSGAAGGMLSTARLLGQTVGAAGVAVLFRTYAQRGSQVTLYIAAGFAVAAALLSLSRLTPEPPDGHAAPD
jgi:MFS transporter, DHA2 family, multidrug resistance protein